MTPFEVNGHQYVMEKMNARKQFHLARKLLTVLGPLAGTVLGLKPEQFQALKDGKGLDSVGLNGVDFVMPLAKAIAALPDADADQILNTCLETLRRQDANTWQPIITAGVIRYDDVDLPTMMQLAMRVIVENLGPFLKALPQSSGEVE